VRRREFIVGLGSAVGWPVVARAQRPTMPVISYLGIGTFDTLRIAALHRGLSETGYIEGQNLVTEYRWAEGHYDRLPDLAADLVRRKVAAIAVTTSPALTAAKAAPDSIPIVFAIGADPVEAGFVASLNHPGGNLTGVYNLTAAVTAKRLELLHEMVPAATKIAHLVNLANPVFAESEARQMQIAARALGVNLLAVNASSRSEFEAAFATAVREVAGGVVVGGDGMFANESSRLVALAARHALPAIYDRREATDAGGLMSYGTDFPDTYRLAGVYTGRILKGEKPADLPVQQATKMELVINLKTAKALGLTIPPNLLALADGVIE
jgi:putative tryptophan/tyrosine transport system substrate-binding protein